MNKSNLWIILSALFIVLGFGIYYSSHAEQILVLQANYYGQKNDKLKAIKCYEGAFDMGYNDTKARDKYVQLMLEMPSDAEIQDRLVKFLKYPVSDTAKYQVQQNLTKLRNEVYRKYPENYIRQATLNQKVVRWSNVPITYVFVNENQAPSYYTKSIEAAFTTWENATGHRILFSQNRDENSNIIIRFRIQQQQVDNYDKYVVAYTKPVIKGNTLKAMTIDFYITNPDGDNYTENQVYNTALHEIAHALGFMGHSDNPGDLMYLSANRYSNMKDLRVDLSQADINTINLLYSIKPDISDTNFVKSEYLPYLVFGNDRDVANAKIREAKIYINNAPTLPSGYMDLAEGYVAATDYQRAIKNLNKALTLAEDSSTQYMIYYNLAITYYLMNDYDNAVASINKAIKINNTEDCHYMLAQVYNDSNMIDKAIEEYELLMDKSPSNIEYVIALTNIYVRKHNYIMARKILGQFIKKNPHERNNTRFAPYGIIKIGL